MTPRLGDPTTSAISTVVTDRLTLRAWEPDDVAPYAEWAADPEMARYTGSPKDGAAVWRMVTSLTGHWVFRWFGMWAMEETATGRMLGRAGLYQGPDWPGVEVAWTVAHDRWGEGLASEGGAAAVWFGFEVIGLDRIVSLMHEDNAASRRVAEKLGLTFEKVEPAAFFGGDPTCHYWISRDEWAAQNASGAAAG